MRARTALSVAAIVASGVYLGVRFLPGVFEGEADYFALDADEKAVLREARAAYAAFPVLAITETTTAADLQSVLDAAPEQPVPPPTPQIPGTLSPEEARRHRADLNRLMAEFLLYAVVKGDPDEYAEWRFGRGDRLPSREEFERTHFLTETWTELTGGPPPDGLTSREAVRFLHERARSSTPPERRVVGIADHPHAAFTQVWFDNRHVFFTPALPEPLGERGWVGARAVGGLSYFIGSVTHEELYAVDGPILRARCGVILIDAGGQRLPLILHAFRTPADGRWNIDFVHFGNSDPAATPGLTW